MKNIRLLWQYRELLWNLAHREISQRYKQSVLGYAWVLLNPLFQMLVISFVFSVILKVPSHGAPFILFLSAALLPWNLLVNSLTSSSNVLVSNSPLITKIYFPREILVYATIIAKIIDFLYSCLILLAFLVIFHIPISFALLWVPLIILIQLVLIAGISLMLATFNLFYRDIQYLLSLVITLWMYLTPVMYPVEIIPEKYRVVFALNPMAGLINSYRLTIWEQTAPDITSLFFVILMSLVIFAIGLHIFKSREGKFADYV